VTPPSRLAGAAKRRAAVGCQECRQTADQWVHQPIDAPFRHGDQFGNCDTERVGAQTDRCADRVGLRNGPRSVFGSHNQGVVGRCRQLGIHRLRGTRKLIARSPMHVGDGAQAQGILGTSSGAGGENRASLEYRLQPFAYFRDSRGCPQGHALGIESRQLAVQVLKCHG
jgi:hypothetical protein